MKNIAFEVVTGEIPSLIDLAKKRPDAEVIFDLLALEQHIMRFKACPEREAAWKQVGEVINQFDEHLLLDSASVLTPEGWIEDAKHIQMLSHRRYPVDEAFIQMRSTTLLMQLDEAQLGLLNLKRRLNRDNIEVDLSECIDFVDVHTEVFMCCVDWVKQMTEGYEFLPDLQRRDGELYDTLGILYSIICDDDFRQMTPEEYRSFMNS